MASCSAKIRIIGVGNPLMGDDGIGIAAAERLAARQLPPGVEVIDGGTGGLTLLDLMAGAETVLLIDAVAMDRAPGSIARFSADEIDLEAEAGLSLHETGLPAVFALGREMDLLPPRIVIFGVEPESVERRLGLSVAVEAALDPLVDQVLAEAGVAFDRREDT
jgi:hydrogenase maturation protease